MHVYVGHPACDDAAASSELDYLSKAKVDRGDEPSVGWVAWPGCFNPASVSEPDVGDGIESEPTGEVKQARTWSETQHDRPERLNNHFGGEYFVWHPLNASGATATTESHGHIVDTADDIAPSRPLRRRQRPAMPRPATVDGEGCAEGFHDPAPTPRPARRRCG